MRYKIILLIIVLAASIFALPQLRVDGNNQEDVKRIIREVASDYRSEQGFNNACYVDGQEVSLGAVMYGLAMNEGGRKPGTVGYRTNNWGSLHHQQGLKTPASTISADNSDSWPVYASAYDGLYEKAHLIAREDKMYDCNITYRTLACYIMGCNADMNSAYGNTGLTKKQYVLGRLSLLRKNALEFDQNKPEYSLVRSPNEQPQQKNMLSDEIVEDDTKKCQRIDYTKADYIQIDTYEGDYVGKSETGEGVNKVFKCWNK